MIWIMKDIAINWRRKVKEMVVNLYWVYIVSEVILYKDYAPPLIKYTPYTSTLRSLFLIK